jgi:hypothetical protein
VCSGETREEVVEARHQLSNDLDDDIVLVCVGHEDLDPMDKVMHIHGNVSWML